MGSESHAACANTITACVPVLCLHEQVDKVNTQMAAGLVTTLVTWVAFDEDRQQLMLAQLNRFEALGDKVSEDVMEVVRQAIRE